MDYPSLSEKIETVEKKRCSCISDKESELSSDDYNDENKVFLSYIDNFGS